jgi:hypothetical protein
MSPLYAIQDGMIWQAGNLLFLTESAASRQAEASTTDEDASCG